MLKNYLIKKLIKNKNININKKNLQKENKKILF